MITDEDPLSIEIVRTGRTVLFRWKCEKCNTEQFEGLPQCHDCGHPAKGTFTERVIGSTKRQGIKHKAKQRKLREQNNCCAWCGRPFGIFYEDTKRNRITELKVHWDHVLPYSYLACNLEENYVAACHVCNLFKSASVFRDEDDLRAYLADKWNRKLKSGAIIFLETRYGTKPIYTQEQQ
jgi:hypothetical protein